MARRKKSRLGAGDVFAQKYVIMSVLGEGGMGVVYEAEHTMLAQRVAIKMLKDSALESEEFVKRFGREARASAKLRGPNVARVYDVDILDDGTPYMVMEYLDGHDLGTEIDARGRLPVDEAVGYVLEACSAMHEAHELGIVHRDLKPSNLYFADQKEGDRLLKVLDFGISKTLLEQEVSVTMTQSSLGTPMYMSPEQIRSAKKVDKRTDIWSLGIILYEMLVGDPPFDGESPSAIIASVTADPIIPPREKRPGVPKELNEVVMKALAKNADARFGSIEELALALLPFAPSPDLWAPPSARSNPRASSPSLSGQGDFNPTVNAADLSADVEASDPISSTGQPAVTADPLATSPGVTSPARGSTQESWTADSADHGRRSTRTRAVLGALALGAAAGAGFFVFTGRDPEPPAVAPASVPETTEQKEPTKSAPPSAPTEKKPEVAPTLSSDGGTPPSSKPKPIAAGKKPVRVGRGGAPAGIAPARKKPVAPAAATAEEPAKAPEPAPATKPATPKKRHPVTL